jgi:hypothetical protein
LTEEERAPRLAADQRSHVIDPKLVKLIESKLDELNQRMDALERVRKANELLTDLEARMEAERSASEKDDAMREPTFSRATTITKH